MHHLVGLSIWIDIRDLIPVELDWLFRLVSQIQREVTIPRERKADPEDSILVFEGATDRWLRQREGVNGRVLPRVKDDLELPDVALDIAIETAVKLGVRASLHPEDWKAAGALVASQR